MSKMFTAVFGGKRSKSKEQSTSSSSNQAYQPVQQAFNPLLGYAQSGASSLQRLLGGDSTEFDTYRQNTGYDFQKDRGESGINTLLGSKGMRNSGAALKQLVGFNDGLQRSSVNDYIQKLLGFSGVGFQAGQAMTGAGATSNSQSTGSASSREDTGNFGKFLGTLLASDRRLKKDIKKINKLDNGLNVYSFKYKGSEITQVGVMADEVAEFLPEALGPEVCGYMTVDYSKVWSE